ncbi:UDP-N-acetylmuramoyl-tripeptide--D-alanyl-D-alanine ligase [Aerococcus mictus]|uniref:UDP-N-acetylmuramoyl-tripeptide--D-alanyl-D- alanine ligase n=2 Tax=Aerococcaceae TaxID=186827 RepID=UPI001CD76B0B|nr:UDP-N-acetylmuramoyl-tripeptide--D-alanyl-D-alanine ligase [Aerococcus mictus]MDK8389310.1 UDP-N-acetylmuramoyl-tripeptide--D-alanyl-D-alanine ligase [Aerococcus urinae]
MSSDQMKALAINEIVKAVGAVDYDSTAAHDLITSVAFNSKEIKPGGLFIPLKAARDGHDFIQDAIDHGAQATLWANDPADAPSEISVIQVEDTFTAFVDLAKYYLGLIGPKVIAVTGSAGKTTTKDMTAATLSTTFNVYKTQGNYNNQLGVPYTILSMPEDTEVLVVEMGMSGPGEIRFLAQLCPMDVAVITMIGESHIEFLGSRENIAKAKLEILEGLKEDGTFIYPGDEPLIDQAVVDMPEIKKIRVGLDDSEDVYAENIVNEREHTHFYTNLSPNVELSIPVSGDYNVKNALMACAVAYSQGLAVEQIKTPLSQFKLTANRSEWLLGKDDIQILNDTYNANPSAMRAVIRNFSQLERPAVTSHKVLVLGDMLELGKYSASMHASIADEIDRPHIDGVYLYGKEMQALAGALQEKGFPEDKIHYYPEDKSVLIEDLLAQVHPQDQILVKASHGMGLAEVVTALKA